MLGARSWTYKLNNGKLCSPWRLWSIRRASRRFPTQRRRSAPPVSLNQNRGRPSEPQTTRLLGHHPPVLGDGGLSGGDGDLVVDARRHCELHRLTAPRRVCSDHHVPAEVVPAIRSLVTHALRALAFFHPHPTKLSPPPSKGAGSSFSDTFANKLTRPTGRALGVGCSLHEFTSCNERGG